MELWYFVINTTNHTALRLPALVKGPWWDSAVSLIYILNFHIHFLEFILLVIYCCFIAGLLLGIPILKNLEKKLWERYLFYIALIIYITVVGFGIFWNIFWPATGEPGYYPITDWTPIVNSTLIPPKCALHNWSLVCAICYKLLLTVKCAICY